MFADIARFGTVARADGQVRAARELRARQDAQAGHGAFGDKAVDARAAFGTRNQHRDGQAGAAGRFAALAGAAHHERIVHRFGTSFRAHGLSRRFLRHLHQGLDLLVRERGGEGTAHQPFVGGMFPAPFDAQEQRVVLDALNLDDDNGALLARSIDDESEAAAADVLELGRTEAAVAVTKHAPGDADVRALAFGLAPLRRSFEVQFQFGRQPVHEGPFGGNH